MSSQSFFSKKFLANLTITVARLHSCLYFCALKLVFHDFSHFQAFSFAINCFITSFVIHLDLGLAEVHLLLGT